MEVVVLPIVGGTTVTIYLGTYRGRLQYALAGSAIVTGVFGGKHAPSANKLLLAENFSLNTIMGTSPYPSSPGSNFGGQELLPYAQYRQ